MTELLLIAIVILLACILREMKRDPKVMNKTRKSYAAILPDYLQKTCEIHVKDPMPALDTMFSVKGVVIDTDDEWVLLEIPGKKKTVQRLLRIDNIRSIKEIL